jgi:hypothetical protein
MSTLIDAFRINGVIDTKQNVLSNINKIADAAAVWVTFDVNTGLWSFIFNDVDTSILSFNDSNIIGSINVSGTGLTEAYNKVSVEFPHKDLRDQTDYIDLSIPVGDRFLNELDNTLNIKYDLVNNPVQAQYLATVELKQSRVDRIIEFRTDYTGLGAKAGQLIDITNSQLGFVDKLFRVTRIEEIDNDDGSIELSITALEYDADVYDSSGLIYEERSKVTGIAAKITNTATQQKDDQSTGETLLRLLGLNMATGLLNSVLTKNPITGKVTQTVNPTSPSRDAALSKVKKPGVVITGASSICEGATLTLTLDLDCSSCLFDPIEYDYTITGVQSADITPFPLTGKVNVPGTMSIPIATDASAESETMTVTVGTATKAVTINDRLTFTYVTTASPTVITEGASSTVTLTTTGVANGTSVPYAITGSGISRVTTALTGNVTVNSNTATLTVNTTDDAVYTGPQSITVTFNTAQADPCSQLDKIAAITILDNDPEPTVCATVNVPVVWCPVYSGSTGQVTGLTPAAYATVSAAYSGGPSTTVPLTVSVTPGNPSSVTVLTTATIDASSNKGGQDFNVITTFNTIAPNALPTGTTTTIRGY